MNKGAFSTFVLYRPVTGRVNCLPWQLKPNIEDNTVFQLSANARQRLVRSSGNLPPLSKAKDDFSAK
jgi:hypothetical protein